MLLFVCLNKIILLLIWVNAVIFVVLSLVCVLLYCWLICWVIGCRNFGKSVEWVALVEVANTHQFDLSGKGGVVGGGEGKACILLQFLLCELLIPSLII